MAWSLNYRWRNLWDGISSTRSSRVLETLYCYPLNVEYRIDISISYTESHDHIKSAISGLNRPPACRSISLPLDQPSYHPQNLSIPQNFFFSIFHSIHSTLNLIIYFAHPNINLPHAASLITVSMINDC